MPQADRLEITHVHVAPKGDAYFPRDRRRTTGARCRATCALPDAVTRPASPVRDLFKALRRRKARQLTNYGAL